MIHLDLRPQTGVPIFKQVMDQIRYYIASGVLKPGQQLPSVRDLAQNLHINPMTVSKAYSLLTMQGILETRKGLGVFVSEQQSTMNQKAKEGVLRPIASHLAVEATQLKISKKRVHEIVDDEMEKITKKVSK